MGISRLDLYNNALLYCGERFLATLAEDREPRRLLDQVWATNGVDYCLEQGQWWHAMRTVRIDADPAITTPFGYKNAFTKPTDWINTSAVCSDEFFNTPITQYADERADWYCDVTPIFVKYISNDAAFGGDLMKWPASFADYAAVYFASRIISKLAGDKAEQMKAIFGPPGQPDKGLLMISLHRAKSAAAQTQPTQWPAQGQWTRARQGWRNGVWRDGGYRNRLIG